jgi:hypothetical protein
MTTWCFLGLRALLRRLSAFIRDPGRSLGNDSQPFAIHTGPVIVNDQTLDRSIRTLAPKWPAPAARFYRQLTALPPGWVTVRTAGLAEQASFRKFMLYDKLNT